MSIYKKFSPLVFCLFIILVVVSCSNNDDGPPPANNTIAELVANSPNLSMLQSAIERAGLESTLQGSALLTLFAPTNTAFTIFLANANFPSINDVPVDVLEKLLLNHVLGTRVDESLLRALGRNYTETLAGGPESGTNLALYFNALGSAIVLNGSIEVEEADIAATNGLVHIVDTVIDFPTLATFVQSNEAFSQLTTALTTATPGTNFINLLSGSAPYTLFAPVDQAFDDLLDSNPSWNTVADIEEGLLTAVLQHHVISGNIRSEEINNNDAAPTLEGDLITFSTANGELTITDGSGNSGITVIVSDIQANNGVLHAVDQVLIPNTAN